MEEVIVNELTIRNYIRIGEYTLGKTIGTGGFGKVKLGENDRTNSKVAVKILNRQLIKSLQVVDKIQKEIENMQMIDHPHIVQLYQVISTPTDIYMIMEYVSGGELFDYIAKNGRLREPEARRFFQQIISGIDYCHRRMIVHRDLKPENLLLDRKMNVKIADFGLSKVMLDGEFLHTSCGSPHYAAPEIISGKLYAGPEVDVWSCGVILYTLLCGHLPFDGKDFAMLYGRIRAGQFPLPEQLNSEAATLIRKMLQVSPVQRITIESIRQCDWFRKDCAPYILDAVQIAAKSQHQQQNSCSSAETLQQIFRPSIGLRKCKFGAAFAGSVGCTDEKRFKWRLGVCSPSHPIDIMHELYKSLLALNFEWFCPNPYHIHARHLNSKTQRYVEISLQLYQATPKSCLVDFKSVNETESHEAVAGAEQADVRCHHTMEFLDLCAKIITQLALCTNKQND